MYIATFQRGDKILEIETEQGREAYRGAMKTNTFRRWKKIYKIASTVAAVAGIGYLLLLGFPQMLFAHSIEHGKFRVYSREPLGEGIEWVLDKAEEKLKSSPIYDAGVQRNVYLTGSHGVYALLSHKAYRSFANSLPFIDNIIINKTDVAADRVILNREFNNTRSLSGVIAHETAHLFIRKHFGAIAATMMPTWKNEGYCEYIAGDTTITLEEGIGRWRENPQDDANYRYIKYQLMVRQLLEREGVSLDDLFNKSWDEKAVADRTFAAL